MTIAVATIVCAGAPTFAAEVVIVERDGRAVEWDDWVGDYLPAAVVCWASWVPGADDIVAELPRFEEVARAAGLSLVVVSVQEERAASARALGRMAHVPWAHDRHGAVLKKHRIVRIPAIVVIEADGSVAARMEATLEALEGWKRP